MTSPTSPVLPPPPPPDGDERAAVLPPSITTASAGYRSRVVWAMAAMTERQLHQLAGLAELILPPVGSPTPPST